MAQQQQQNIEHEPIVSSTPFDPSIVIISCFSYNYTENKERLLLSMVKNRDYNPHPNSKIHWLSNETSTLCVNVAALCIIQWHIALANAHIYIVSTRNPGVDCQQNLSLISVQKTVPNINLLNRNYQNKFYRPNSNKISYRLINIMSRWPEQPVLWWSWLDHKDRSETDEELQIYSFNEYIYIFIDGYGRNGCSQFPLILNHWILIFEGSLPYPDCPI